MCCYRRVRRTRAHSRQPATRAPPRSLPANALCASVCRRIPHGTAPPVHSRSSASAEALARSSIRLERRGERRDDSASLRSQDAPPSSKRHVYPPLFPCCFVPSDASVSACCCFVLLCPYRLGHDGLSGSNKAEVEHRARHIALRGSSLSAEQHTHRHVRIGHRHPISPTRLQIARSLAGPDKHTAR
jgi:hypothetical protein